MVGTAANRGDGGPLNEAAEPALPTATRGRGPRVVGAAEILRSSPESVCAKSISPF